MGICFIILSCGCLDNSSLQKPISRVKEIRASCLGEEPEASVWLQAGGQAAEVCAGLC